MMSKACEGYCLASGLRRQRFRSVLMFLFAVMTCCCGGREIGPTELMAQSSEGASAVPPVKPEVRLSVARTSAGGTHVYTPESWGVLQLTVANTRNVPHEILCSTFFDGESSMQFGRKMWLPAHSQLRTIQPVLVPPRKPEEGTTLNFRTLIVDSESAGEVLHRDESGKMMHDAAVSIWHGGNISGILGATVVEPDSPEADAIEMLRGMRVHQLFDKRIAQLSDMFLIDEASSLDSLDHLLVFGSRLADDQRALSAVRDWTHAGGHLWIMLDLAETRLVEMLLGDEFRCCEFDRIGLTSVRVDSHLERHRNHVPTAVEFEKPVTLVRCSVTNANVTHSVNGWPAAFSIPYGDGLIVVTTLGAKAWMRDLHATVNYSNSMTAQPRKSPDVRYGPTPELAEISDTYFSIRSTELIPKDALESHAAAYIGYAVPSRMKIVGVLASVLVLLAVAGVIMTRLGRAEQLGWVGPLLAVLGGISLLLVGRANRQAVADSLAIVQHHQPLPGTDDVRVNGLATVYRQEGSTNVIESTSGGRLVPSMKGLDGTVRRLVWSDIDRWSWQNLPQNAGQSSSGFVTTTLSALGLSSSKADSTSGALGSESRATHIKPIVARVTFDSKGVVGSIASTVKISDAVLATRDGRLGVELQPDGAFAAPTSASMGRDQYLSAELLGDEQDRRRRTLRSIFTNKQRRDFPAKPLVLAWADAQPTGLSFGDDLVHRGATLLSIPLTLIRPVTNDEFVIPGAFISFRNTMAPDGMPSSGIWSQIQRSWQDRADPSSTWLRFQIPPELLPLDATRGLLEVAVTGPVGLFELLAIQDGKPVALKTIIDPVGTLKFEVNDPKMLQVSESGTVTLGINAGDPSRPELTRSAATGVEKLNYWRIESLSLQLWAKTRNSD